LREQLPLNEKCHADLEMNGVMLINSGFPVNFDGERENIEPELIQLTIALITAGILQGRNLPLLSSPGIISLDKYMENEVKRQFTQLQSLSGLTA
jgi:hypothetical protein